MSYLGLGPRETVADRTAGGRMGAWDYGIREDFAQNSPVYPQECGSRTGVYRANVTGSIPGICFESGTGMTFSALPYPPTNWKMPGTSMSCPETTARRSCGAQPSSAVWAATTAGAQTP